MGIKLTKSPLSKLASFVLVFVLVFSAIIPSISMAASVTAFSVLLSREKESVLANHTITFTTPTGIASGATVVLTYDNSTSIPAALDFEDIDITDDGADRTLTSGAPGADVQVVRTSSTVITITNGTTVFAAGSVVVVEIGTHATSGATGVEQITNGAAGTSTLVLSGSFGDTGTAAMPINDDDQVSVTATVNSSITFDLDTATTDTNSDDPYSVALGTLTVGAVNRSGATINSIWADLNTNATGGAVVTVTSLNAALDSTSVPTDTIPSATATMAAGTANYGLCVASNTAGSGTLNDVAPFNGATCADGAVNNVGAVTTSPQNILNTAGAPIATGRAQIRVNAAISGVTVAHNDYTDTLTFIATGTF